MASFCSSASQFRRLILPSSARPKPPSVVPPLRLLHFPPTLSSKFSLLGVGVAPQPRALKTSDDTNDPALLRKPSVVAEKLVGRNSFLELEDSVDDEEAGGADRQRCGESTWIDWEDRILEDTVPLVGFVRSILHSGKYESGDRLSPEDEKMIIEKLLPYHPEVERKIGSGIDFITIGYHPDFENSRCLFIVRKDGVVMDFSFWKCIKGFIRKKYPLYADSFIIRHFRNRRRNDQAPI